MNQLLSLIGSVHRTRPGLRQSGQAMLEFVFVVFMMIVMLFALIDFGKIVYEKQILVNVTREGSNLASRGSGSSELDIMSNAMNAVIASANPLTISTKGCVIISAVTNSNNVIKVTAQVSSGGVRATSKIGAVGTSAAMPATTPAIPLTNTTSYVTEVFYTYAPLTALGKLMKFALPTTNYDVAYF